MLRQPVFCTLVQASKVLGLPRDWLLNETSTGRIPHLIVGGQIYLHMETVIDCVVGMMRRNVTSDYAIPMLLDACDTETANPRVPATLLHNYDPLRATARQAERSSR